MTGPPRKFSTVWKIFDGFSMLWKKCLPRRSQGSLARSTGHFAIDPFPHRLSARARHSAVPRGENSGFMLFSGVAAGVAATPPPPTVPLLISRVKTTHLRAMVTHYFASCMTGIATSLSRQCQGAGLYNNPPFPLPHVPLTRLIVFLNDRRF